MLDRGPGGLPALPPAVSRTVSVAPGPALRATFPPPEAPGRVTGSTPANAST